MPTPWPQPLPSTTSTGTAACAAGAGARAAKSDTPASTRHRILHPYRTATGRHQPGGRANSVTVRAGNRIKRSPEPRGVDPITEDGGGFGKGWRTAGVKGDHCGHRYRDRPGPWGKDLLLTHDVATTLSGVAIVVLVLAEVYRCNSFDHTDYLFLGSVLVSQFLYRLRVVFGRCHGVGGERLGLGGEVDLQVPCVGSVVNVHSPATATPRAILTRYRF